MQQLLKKSHGIEHLRTALLLEMQRFPFVNIFYFYSRMFIIDNTHTIVIRAYIIVACISEVALFITLTCLFKIHFSNAHFLRTQLRQVGK